MRTEQVFGVAIFPIQKDRPLLGFRLRNQDEIVKERSDLTDRFDDSPVVSQFPLLQSIQKRGQIPCVVSQVPIILDVPLFSYVCRGRGIMKMENLNAPEQLPNIKELILTLH